MIKILGIDNGEPSVQYTAGPYIDKLIPIVGDRVPRLSEYVTFKDNCVVVVHLNSIEQVRKVFIESSSRLPLNILNLGANSANVSDLTDYICNEVFKLCQPGEIKMRK